jgi:hypothetical protein
LRICRTGVANPNSANCPTFAHPCADVTLKVAGSRKQAPTLPAAPLTPAENRWYSQSLQFIACPFLSATACEAFPAPRARPPLVRGDTTGLFAAVRSSSRLAPLLPLPLLHLGGFRSVLPHPLVVLLRGECSALTIRESAGANAGSDFGERVHRN